MTLLPSQNRLGSQVTVVGKFYPIHICAGSADMCSLLLKSLCLQTCSTFLLMVPQKIACYYIILNIPSSVSF